jgi:outer membrane lipoprotein-sorting protein
MAICPMRFSGPPTEPLPRIAGYLGVAAMAASFACAPPRYVPATPPPSDPAAVLEGIRRREDEVRSLRAAFKATAFHELDQSDVQGVVLVRKPDRFRMRLMLPLGITVLDYVSHGDKAWTFLPLSKDDNAEETPTLLSPRDVRETFQRGTAAFPGTCSASSGSSATVDVECRPCDECPILRSMRLDRRRGTISEETSYDTDGPRLSIRYDDYREVDGLPLPFHILMSYPTRRLKVEIRIRAYEVNPELKDELFAPPAGAKRTTVAVSPYRRAAPIA